MKSPFNIEDRVVTKKTVKPRNRPLFEVGDAGEVIRITAFGEVEVLFDEAKWGDGKFFLDPEDLELEEVYNSPLYQALK